MFVNAALIVRAKSKFKGWTALLHGSSETWTRFIDANRIALLC
jgi:hypothetical protein